MAGTDTPRCEACATDPDGHGAAIADSLPGLVERARRALAPGGGARRIRDEWTGEGAPRQVAGEGFNYWAATFVDADGATWLACEERHRAAPGRPVRIADAVLREQWRLWSEDGVRADHAVVFVRPKRSLGDKGREYLRRLQPAYWNALGGVFLPAVDDAAKGFRWKDRLVGQGRALVSETFDAAAEALAELEGARFPDIEDPCTQRMVHRLLAPKLAELGWSYETQGRAKDRAEWSYPALGASPRCDGAWVHASAVVGPERDPLRLAVEIKRQFATDPGNPLAQVAEALGYGDAALHVRCATPRCAEQLDALVEMKRALRRVEGTWAGWRFLQIPTGEATDVLSPDPTATPCCDP